ncbi:MAG: signal peptide peptidase SppA [Candidatus Riflebacteria bacterium]|nr:signal peptide peptidase SppA [Candidatus Riflebacteria bacterium]
MFKVKFFKFFCLLGLLMAISTPSISGGLFDLLESWGGDEFTKKTEVVYVEGDKNASDEILLIKINGVISETEEEGPLDLKKDIIENIKKEVKLALKREKIKAILLEINSPGGEVTTCDIIYHQLLKIKDAKKPIVALIGTIGASGGYYIACAADKIMAHPTSIIGSIGVLMQGFNIEKLANVIGIKDVTIKSLNTPKKDILSPFREMTPEEKKMLTGIVDFMYNRFVEIVAKARGKSSKEITPLADGSIFSSSEAQKNGLIDSIGYRDEAIEEVLELSNLKSAKLVKRKIKKNVIQLFNEFADMNSSIKKVLALLESSLSGKTQMKLMLE